MEVPNNATNTLKVIEKINEIVELHKSSFSYKIIGMMDYQIEPLTSYEMEPSQLGIIANNYFCNYLVFEVTNPEVLSYDGYSLYGNKEGEAKIRLSLRFNDDEEKLYDASYKKGLDNDVYMKGWDEDTIAWVAYQIYKGEEPEAFESVSTITVKTGE